LPGRSSDLIGEATAATGNPVGLPAAEAAVEACNSECGQASVALSALADGEASGAVVLPLGRLVVVLAATVVFSHGGLSASLLVAGVFFVCLQRSFAVTLVGLGPAAAAMSGAIIGLLAMLPLTLWSTAWGIGPLALAGTALGICLVVPPVDHLLRQRIGRRSVVVVVDAVGLAEFYERELRRMPPREVTLTWLATLPHVRPRVLPEIPKRAFDIVVAVVGLLLTAPLWILVVAATVRTRRSLFFHQQRVGKGGELFTMYKIRTMGLDAEPLGQAVWAGRSDPRVRCTGRFLRKTHLDELPQLWNVLRGEMSIVGPRPERPELVTMLEVSIPHWAQRQLVRPGITGWAQVRQGYSGDHDGSEEKLSYDLWYVRHRTLLLDLAICLRTFPRMVLGATTR
jgi:lipopolysaccharide/colanic/teichoic acid biosynthesis glycosyltransferase